MNDTHTQEYDSNQKHREDFYEALTEFGMCLKVALSSHSFFEDSSFSEADIKRYKEDLRFFINLRKISKHDAEESVDYSIYEQQIGKLVDQHVVGEGVRESDGIYEVAGLSQRSPEEWDEEKTRNETDIIRTRLKKKIDEQMDDDPYAKAYFSKLLKQAIEEAEKLFDHPLKQYALFKAMSEDVDERKVAGVPAELSDKPQAKAYYGAIRLTLGEGSFADMVAAEPQAFIQMSKEIDAVVNRSVAEHSLNPQNIEAEIQKSLLPQLFKTLGGLENAKVLLEHVMKIVSHGHK